MDSMDDTGKTKEQLIAELAGLRQRVAALEATVAEHTQKEVALQESEARYRLLAENVTDVIWVRDMQFRPTYISPSVTRLRGYSVEEAMSQTLLEALTPASREVAQQAFADALTLERSGQAPLDRFRTLELEATRKDGSTVWIETSVTFLRDADGRPVGLLGVNRDISARKQAEEALQQAHDDLEARVTERTAALQRVNAQLQAEIIERTQAQEVVQQSAERFTKAFHVSPVAMGITRLRDGHYLAVNESFLRITGYSRDEVLGRTTLELARWVDHETREQITQHLLAHGAVHEVETQFRVKSGAIRETLFSATVIELDGEPCILAITQDVTEQKRAHTALRESEERYRALVEQAADGILIAEPHGHYVEVNPSGCAMLGYTREEFLSKRVGDLIPRDDLNAVPLQLEVLRRGDIVVSERRFIRKDGTPLPVEISAKILSDGRLQCIVRDITERKKAEEERQRLEHQLHQSQKMEALGTLAGGIAHEFNNILAVMLGFTEMAALDLPPTHPVYPNFREVLTAGGRAKDLVQRILTFSRQSEHQRQPITLPLLVQESLRLVRASIPSTITIASHIDNDAGTVLADYTHLHQILMNLCVNAEHAMRQTGGILTVGVDRIEVDAAVATPHALIQPGSYVRLTVQDTGYGMSPDVVGRIFEPFFTTKSVGEGTGMGLAIVHGIMTSYGGAITVDSRQGEGATFTIYLPRIADADENRPSPPTESLPQGCGCILFVDDEEMLVTLGRQLLESLGYEVVARSSSLEALDVFRAMPQRFDLVITDQTMPTMTGGALAEALRHIRPDIPIILCTGFSHLVNAEKAQALGIDAFLMKPLDLQKLARTIAHVLGHHEGAEYGFTPFDA